MLELRMYVENRDFKKAEQVAVEVQKVFKQAESYHGEAIAYVFME
jgi:hypothetical protein